MSVGSPSTCGLAEELEREQSKVQSSQPKSACGNVRTAPPDTHLPLTAHSVADILIVGQCDEKRLS